ncbi:uncharacterized protein LOC112561646 [Pomacea canaliculata]|uniref:uncharacterized protein LOC112561646 n=1 Tax=Pomacea canaliculata TaxID=400727 RepID=UPI000D7254E4|nr:uncharacterized protein LOC112561646 [Pomacea canaliculata]
MMKTAVLLLTCVFLVLLVHTSAQGSDIPCGVRKGRCQFDHLRCHGYYYDGLCAGPPNRRCCVPYGGFKIRLTEVVSQQRSNSKLMMKTSVLLLTCVFLVLLCVCVLPAHKLHPDLESDERCIRMAGRCQWDHLPCPGRHVSGFCAGPPNRKCCLPHGWKRSSMN